MVAGAAMALLERRTHLFVSDVFGSAKFWRVGMGTPTAMDTCIDTAGSYRTVLWYSESVSAEMIFSGV